jgi:hypothetical protein
METGKGIKFIIGSIEVPIRVNQLIGGFSVRAIKGGRKRIEPAFGHERKAHPTACPINAKPNISLGMLARRQIRVVSLSVVPNRTGQ